MMNMTNIKYAGVEQNTKQRIFGSSFQAKNYHYYSSPKKLSFFMLCFK